MAESFAYGSGMVVVMAGEVTETWTDDAASNYFKTGDGKWLRQIENLAEGLELKSVLENKHNRLVSAFPITQPEKNRLVVHLVNYDVDYANDSVRQKTDIAVKISRPKSLTGPIEGLWYAPKLDKPERIMIVATGDTLSCRVPRLATTGALVIRGTDEDRHSRGRVSADAGASRTDTCAYGGSRATDQCYV